MDGERVYAAIDLKSFYASVECMARGLDPLSAYLVVADESRTDKTICLAVSPALKAMGLPGRCRLFEVRQLLAREKRRTGREIPLVIAVPRMQTYMGVSSQIYRTYLEFVSEEDIHVYSIDEVFIDLTGYLRLYGSDARGLTARMIREVLRKTGLTATAGIGPNLYLAKVAMDILAKHAPADADGVRIAVLSEAEYRRSLWAHTPITDFWRVGRGLSRRLEQHGMRTMGDVARMSLRDEEMLYRLLGIDAELLIDHAWGLEPCGMPEIKAYRSDGRTLGTMQVLSCAYAPERAEIIVREMADALAMELTEKELLADRVQLYIGYERTGDTGPETETETDWYGRTVPKSSGGHENLGEATASARRIIGAAVRIYRENVRRNCGVRRIGLTLGGITAEAEAALQLSLFSDPAAGEREKRLQKTMAGIRRQYGPNAILRGMDLNEDATARERNRQIGGHRA